MLKSVAKKILITIIALSVALVIYLNYQTHFSPEAKQGKINLENIRKVRKGMKEKKVIEIMGKPDEIDYCDLDSLLKGYNYNTNDDSWVYVTACLDSTMTVQSVYHPKNID